MSNKVHFATNPELLKVPVGVGLIIAVHASPIAGNSAYFLLSRLIHFDFSLSLIHI